jgi:acetyl esterase/lipase
MGGRAMAGPPGGPPAGGPQGARGPGGPPGRNSNVSRNTDLALAAGYVLVQPGCRGRENKAADGANFGKAPAAIVDLKAAVRYLRHNAGLLPGNPEWIVSTGVSAGGALSALLGVSGNSRMYDSYLKEIGAAQAADNIFASADFCPIIDLEHADMAYEWMFGTVPSRSGLQDQELSKQLKEAFAVYQASLKLRGRSGFGTLTADNYAAYLLQTYLFPSAEKSLKALPDDKRKDYLEKNAWMKWDGSRATFSFADYLAHIGRMKNLPAFDDFDARAPEPNLFGNRATDSRHFTEFSLRHATGNPIARLDEDVLALVNLMNPMYFIGQNNPGIAGHWWIRHGSSDRDTSLPVIINLATSLENRKKDVNTWLYWDAGHGADEDPEEFIAWIGTITGFGGRNQSR